MQHRATYKKPPAQLSNMVDRSGTRKEDLDTDEIVAVVEEYPVRCAVLFGSRVHGAATASSDVDIAVAFEDGLSSATRLERRIELTTALSKALGIDDVAVTDLDRVRPEVGRYSRPVLSSSVTTKRSTSTETGSSARRPTNHTTTGCDGLTTYSTGWRGGCDRSGRHRSANRRQGGIQSPPERTRMARRVSPRGTGLSR